MNYSFFKIAFRNLLRKKLYSTINIFGLAIGIMSCIIIMLYVIDELSYDKHFENYDNIYRVNVSGVVGGNDFYISNSAFKMAEAIVEEFPEVEMATRVRRWGFPVVRYGDKAFSEERWTPADSNFFEVFSCEFIQGDAATALSDPNSVVITRSIAEKYFGDEDPIGKVLTTDRVSDYTVTAVIEDFPRNTHFHYDFIFAMHRLTMGDMKLWIANNYYTYFTIREGYDYKELE